MRFHYKGSSFWVLFGLKTFLKYTSDFDGVRILEIGRSEGLTALTSAGLGRLCLELTAGCCPEETLAAKLQTVVGQNAANLERTCMALKSMCTNKCELSCREVMGLQMATCQSKPQDRVQ